VLVLLSVSVLLSEPNPDESVVLDVAELCRSDRDRYNATAERFTALYATADQVSLDQPRVWCG